MQAVRIIERIAAYKQQKNIHPAYVTFREIDEEYEGCMSQMIKELDLAISEGLITEGRTLNDKYYELWQEKTLSSATSTEQSQL